MQDIDVEQGHYEQAAVLQTGTWVLLVRRPSNMCTFACKTSLGQSCMTLDIPEISAKLSTMTLCAAEHIAIQQSH